MKVVVSGGSGFIGQALVPELVARGDSVVVLSRDPGKVQVGRGVAWKPPERGPWESELADAAVIVNLAGDNIGSSPWTRSKKKRMVDSRLHSTEALVRGVQAAGSTKPMFLSASAVGYYGSRGEEILDESSSPGEGFLAELCRRWEAAARQVEQDARLVISRFGVVLDREGGMLSKLLLPFRLFVGGRVGDGRQWLSWIDRQDLVRSLVWLIDRSEAEGVYNLSSPEPVTNRVFVRTLGKVLHRPAAIPVPALPLKIALGDMADDTLLTSQRVIPRRALAEGFEFQYPDVESSLRRTLGT